MLLGYLKMSYPAGQETWQAGAGACTLPVLCSTWSTQVAAGLLPCGVTGGGGGGTVAEDSTQSRCAKAWHAERSSSVAVAA
jgi:hypothetical protein